MTKKFTRVLTFVSFVGALAAFSSCSSTPVAESPSDTLASEVPTELPTNESDPSYTASAETAPVEPSVSEVAASVNPPVQYADASDYAAPPAPKKRSSPVNLGASSAGRSH